MITFLSVSEKEPNCFLLQFIIKNDAESKKAFGLWKTAKHAEVESEVKMFINHLKKNGFLPEGFYQITDKFLDLDNCVVKCYLKGTLEKDLPTMADFVSSE